MAIAQVKRVTRTGLTPFGETDYVPTMIDHETIEELVNRQSSELGIVEPTIISTVFKTMDSLSLKYNGDIH